MSRTGSGSRHRNDGKPYVDARDLHDRPRNRFQRAERPDAHRARGAADRNSYRRLVLDPPPVLLAIVLAAMIVVATWPMMLKLQQVVRGRALAVTIMSGVMVLVFVVPLVLAIQTVVDNMDTIKGWIGTLATSPIPAPPEWLARIPLVGAKLAEGWATIAEAAKENLVARLAPHAAQGAQWLAGALGGVGVLAFQFVLTVIIAVVMYTQGETARASLIRFGRRLAGNRGEGVVVLAGAAIRAVALGVVVTALAQTLLAGLGLYAAGIPFAGLLTGVILLLCIAQIGPILVLAPAVFWLFWNDQTAWGTALLIWTVGVGAMRNRSFCLGISSGSIWDAANTTSATLHRQSVTVSIPGQPVAFSRMTYAALVQCRQRPHDSTLLPPRQRQPRAAHPARGNRRALQARAGRPQELGAQVRRIPEVEPQRTDPDPRRW
ncbi:MAG: AI-2E family transporter [Betaproteobacteria bacterium]